MKATTSSQQIAASEENVNPYQTPGELLQLMEI